MCFYYVFQIEVENGDELIEDFLIDELHPKKNIINKKFDKPKGPPGRGARRLMSNKQPEDA